MDAPALSYPASAAAAGATLLRTRGRTARGVFGMNTKPGGQMKIKLRGIKVQNDCSFLSGSGDSDPDFVEKLCWQWAARKINLALLAHISEGARVAAAPCRMEPDGDFPGGLRIHPDVGTVSVFPHEQRPDIMGRLLKVLAGENIFPYAIASSPSALSVVVSSEKIEDFTRNLFAPFEFPDLYTAGEWHAAYMGQAHILKEIVCSYQEEIIKVYNVNTLGDLSFRGFGAGLEELGRLGGALEMMRNQGLAVPFLVGIMEAPGRLRFALAIKCEHSKSVDRLLTEHLPDTELTKAGPAASFTLHGPHFGDRFGIAHALVKSVAKAGVRPLAISCAVSSLSVIVEAQDLDSSLEALSAGFDIPGGRF